MDKRQETLLALIIGGLLLVIGLAWLVTNDSWGATILTLLSMIIPGTAIFLRGVRLLVGNKAEVPNPNARLKRYDWILISIGLAISLFFLAFFIWGINQG